MATGRSEKMKMFYLGVGDSAREGLKIEDGVLYGKRFLRPWVLIAPSDVTDVRVYLSFLKVWSTKGNFVLGSATQAFDEVAAYLRDNTPFDPTATFTYKYIVFMERTPIGRLLGKAVSRKRRRGA